MIEMNPTETLFGQKEDISIKQWKTARETGPLKWMAPKSIQDGIYSQKTDVYMFGITMWEIIFGKEPYPNKSAVNAAVAVVTEDLRPSFDKHFVEQLKQIMEECWHKDPNLRPSFKEVTDKLLQFQKELEIQIQQQSQVFGGEDCNAAESVAALLEEAKKENK